MCEALNLGFAEKQVELGKTTPRALEVAVVAHLSAFKHAYRDTRFLPKHHYSLHLRRMLHRTEHLEHLCRVGATNGSTKRSNYMLSWSSTLGAPRARDLWYCRLSDMFDSLILTQYHKPSPIEVYYWVCWYTTVYPYLGWCKIWQMLWSSAKRQWCFKSKWTITWIKDWDLPCNKETSCDQMVDMINPGTQYLEAGVFSWNWCTTQSSTLIGFSIVIHPLWGTTILVNLHIQRNTV